MSARAPSATNEAAGAGRGSVVVAKALPAPDDGLIRVSWTRTALRLALEPGVHPWAAHWRLRRRAPLAAVLVALFLLLLFATGGCASAPLQTVRSSTPSPQPASGLRCESILVSQEVQVPVEGELGDLRVTIDDLPQAMGKLRVLVRRPRFGARLELDADQPAEFDRILDVTPGAGQRSLTIVLSRPRRARDDWPRRECKVCRVDVELTGLFGAREALDSFFRRAVQELNGVESAFATQPQDAPLRPSPQLRELADGLAGEARRCGVGLDGPLKAVQAAISQLDASRAQLYGPEPDLPDAAAVFRAWDAAGAALEGLAASAARSNGWPLSLRSGAGARLRASAHLDAAAQLSSIPAEDKPTAARWITVALAPDAAALQKRLAGLPSIRSLDDAQARLDWVNARSGSALPVPGISRPAGFRVRDQAVPIRGKRCIGSAGAAPVRNPDEDAVIVARLLGSDPQRLRIERVADIPSARAALRRSSDLLCEPPAPDLTELFKGVEDKDLGPMSERLEEIFAAADPRRDHDELARGVLARTSQILCRAFDAEAVAQRVSTVAAYKIFVEGGTRILELLPQPLICGKTVLTAREIRRRLRATYREALDRHAVKDRLCPVRSGKCPDEVAASVRRIFGLHRPDLAAPAPSESRRLDFPPPFGFSDEWVQKLDRCAQEACEALSRLRSEAPGGQFDGPICPPRPEGVERPQEVTLSSPESPSSLTLGCDAHAGVRLTLRRLGGAGTLVAIASAYPFRYGSENVTRQGRHPQLGRIYERVADLTDPDDVPRRTDSLYEMALTPTVANQVFYFFSLRRRDY
ncbi:MAG TPA: hypothetical protein VEP66_05460 [Myxococcales bacterium]|nr:hypothetical protein [Myxococcales bacterium]